ncbi:MAG: hypothetical protein ABSH37_23955 [Bryobacteraceae bacterium]
MTKHTSVTGRTPSLLSWLLLAPGRREASRSKLATTSDDNTAQIYAFAPLQLLLLVRSRITRDLTPDECRRYLASEVCPPLPDVA